MNSRKSTPKQTLALREAKQFVIYGLSRSLTGYGNDVIEGVTKMRPDASIFIVHPDGPELRNYPVVRSAVELGQLDGCLALIILNGKDASIALKDISKTNIKAVWLVQNAYTPETARYARDAGIEVVKGCPLLFVENPEGFHRFHWKLARFFGRI